MVIFLALLTGCDNKREDNKNQYLAMKSSLIEQNDYVSLDDMVCDVVVDVARLSEEKLEYNVYLFNPKESMYDMKVIVIHNYYTEEVFPTIGLFDDDVDLVNDGNEYIDFEDVERGTNVVSLNGAIETTDNIDNLDLEFKVLIEFTDLNGNKRDVYYKTT